MPALTPDPLIQKKAASNCGDFFVEFFLSFFQFCFSFFWLFLAFSHMVFCYSPICWHRMSLSNARQRCLAIKDDMPHRMLLDINARLYHALGLGYNNATGICRNLYFTCERKEKKEKRVKERGRERVRSGYSSNLRSTAGNAFRYFG